MCSIDSGLWCWDVTNQAASDDAPSQHRGLRGVLSFSFEVGVHQGRVTLPCKSLRGVRVPVPNSYYSWLIVLITHDCKSYDVMTFTNDSHYESSVSCM